LDNAFKFAEVFGTYEYFLGIVASKNDIQTEVFKRKER